MLIRQLSVFVENKKGKLAEVLDELGKNNVDIFALSLADTTDYGILRLIVDDAEKAKNALEAQGQLVKINHIIGLAVDDTPGGLAKALAALNEKNVPIEYMYAFVGKSEKGAMVGLRTDDNKVALEVLENADVTILSQEDICRK